MLPSGHFTCQEASSSQETRKKEDHKIENSDKESGCTTCAKARSCVSISLQGRVRCLRSLGGERWQQQVWVCEEEEGVQAGLDAQGEAAAKLSGKVSYYWLWQRSDSFAGEGCAHRMGEAVQRDRGAVYPGAVNGTAHLC